MTTQDQHNYMVADLVKSNITIKDELTPHDCGLIHMIMGISGEAGELLDSIKKAVIYRQKLDKTNVIEELGDLEFYMAGLRQLLGISRESTLDANIQKLAQRYPRFKYSDRKAKLRKDKKK